MNHDLSSVIGRVTSGQSGRTRALALAAGVLLGACAAPPGDPQLGTAVGAIAGGDLVPDTDTARHNVVQVITTLRDGTQVVGSGIALDEATVLTAAHLVYNFDAFDNGADHAVPPSRVKVFQSIGGPAFSVRSVVTHPTYVEAQLTIPTPFDRNGVIPNTNVFDLAVLSLRDSLPGAVQLSFTTHTAADFGPLESFVVMGFGPDPDAADPTAGVSALRSFNSGNTTVPLVSGYGPTLLEAQATSANQHIVPQDAGGPALSRLSGDTTVGATGTVGKLVAMSMSLRPPVIDGTSQLIFFTPELQTWIKLVSASQVPGSTTCRSRHVAESLTIADDYFASLNDDTPVPHLAFRIEYGLARVPGTNPSNLPLSSITAPICGTGSSLAFADVTGDGDRDVIVQTGATAVTGILNIGTGSPPPPPTLSAGNAFTLPDDESFAGFENMQFTGKGGDAGLIGTTRSGKAYLFGASGLTYTVFPESGAPQLFYGFPTADGTDGKFVSVIGDGLATFPQPLASYYIDLPSTETNLRVDIFDGDLGGKNDLGNTSATVDVQYCLYADGSKSGVKTPANLVASIAASDISSDADWTNLFEALLTDASAQTALAADPLGSGSHFYRLDAVLATSCDSVGTASSRIANLFKIRSNGQLGIENGEITFWAGDHGGDFTAFTRASYSDYNFDGTFTFFIDAGGSPEEDLETPKALTISDYDADNLHGTPVGVADGANNEVSWNLLPLVNRDPAVATITPCGGSDVSGAYEDTDDPATKFLGRDHGVTLTRGGLWTWKWTDVLITNAVRLEVKEVVTPSVSCFAKAPLARSRASGAPASAIAAPDPAAASVGSAQYAVYGADVHRLPMSNAQLASAWTSQVLQSAFSPIVVGTKTSCATASHRTVLVDAQSASAVLGNTATVFDQVVAELTAAKLNVRRVAGRTVGLDEALVYGHTYTVASVINAAELAVGQGRGAVPDAQLVGFLSDLRDINQGQITFVGARAIVPLQGGGDADGDGIIEPIDNCSSRPNPDQRDRNLDGIGDACDPHPLLECVDRQPGGGFIAHFAIDHGGPDVFVARGANNSVMGTTALPPTHFPPGNAARVFTASSTGADVTWTVLGNTAVASAISPSCDAMQLADLPLGQQAVLYATDELRIDSGARIGDCADAVSAGTTQTFIAAGAIVGDVYSQAGVFVGSGAQAGIVSSAGTVTPQAGAQIQAIAPLATAPVAPTWSVAFPGGAHPPVTVHSGRAATIAPGTYGAVHVSSGARLNLSPGKYFFDSLLVEPAGVMAVNGAAPLQIYVADGLTFRGRFAAEATPRLAPDLVLAAFGTGTAFVQSPVRAWLAVPNGQLVLGSGPPVGFTGRFTARRIEVRSGVTVSLE